MVFAHQTYLQIKKANEFLAIFSSFILLSLLYGCKFYSFVGHTHGSFYFFKIVSVKKMGKNYELDS